jgi:hypothetical protein
MASVNFKRRREKRERNHHWQQTIPQLLPRIAIPGRRHRDNSNDTMKGEFLMSVDIAFTNHLFI